VNNTCKWGIALRKKMICLIQPALLQIRRTINHHSFWTNISFFIIVNLLMLRNINWHWLCLQAGVVVIDGWLRLTAAAQTAVLFKQLRITLDAVLKELTRKPEVRSLFSFNI
jgi:hypothetical protein